ncbi:MAG: U32 family peptidase [Clostridia bacterium]|nr:U32 family peptidase [Clostridia bacterium]
MSHPATRPFPEVLAPAGSPECLTAAVRCGAAAVYLGADSFNARRGAHNFTATELSEAVAYCHARGVAVHLTLNTLIRQEELEAAMDTAFMAASLGIDALIVQDVGLARPLRAAMPDMPLHASTQLSCHTPAGVAFLRDAGFSRVVLAREMTREEIAACAGLGVELEVFVHGALCMSVSGQCYFSAMLGGRSGNRGACAQTCRLPFSANKGDGRPASPEQAALSLKDNCLVDYVRELTALGVASFKIEGRMKRPEYVAAATTVYTAAARGETPSPEAMEQLGRVFSRSGFTDGYYTDRRGAGMFGVRRHEDVTAAAGVLKDLARLYDKEQPRVPVDMDFCLEGTESRLTVSDGDHDVTVTGKGGEAVQSRPLEPARVEEQLRKTGGTPFLADSVVCAIDPELTLPLSAVNALRREALERLLALRRAPRPVSCRREHRPADLPPVAPSSPCYLLRLATASQWSQVLAGTAVVLPLDTDAATITAIAAHSPVGIEIPRGMFGREEAIREALSRAKAAGAVFALCGNVGALPLATLAGLPAVGGFGLNLTNREAVSFYAEHGLAAATLSMELTFPQIRGLLPAPLPTGLLLYGHQPLMLTRNCPRRCAGASCKDCTGQGLTDRTGTAFPVMCVGGCSEVLNSVPLYWGDKPEDIPSVDFHLLHFTTEPAQQVAAVLTAYRQGGKPPAAITRGLYRRGVE